MNKREKIILVVMLIALLGGAATYFSGPSTSIQSSGAANGIDLTNVKALSAQLIADVKKEALTDNERYVLDQAAADWSEDPFVVRSLTPLHQTGGGSGMRPADFSYSGYLDAGNRRLAIINGLEYMVGDQLEFGGLVVKNIDPEKVVLEDMGKRGQLTIPFTGEIF
jgi:hypothetical protein